LIILIAVGAVCPYTELYHMKSEGRNGGTNGEVLLVVISLHPRHIDREKVNRGTRS
jgi:hypothetical protein